MLAIRAGAADQPEVAAALDEPSMGLAPMMVQQIFGIIAEINRRGTTVLLVEQNASQPCSSAPGVRAETGHVVKSAAGPGSARRS